MSYDSPSGKFTLTTPGRYRVSGVMCQAPGSGTSLIMSATLNSDGVTGTTGSAYQVDGVFAAIENGANGSFYNWGYLDGYLATTSPTDYIQFWFGAGGGTTSTPNLHSSFPGMDHAQWFQVEYAGPPTREY
jgi:hypothetical protein